MPTQIEWADETWNFLVGCNPVSEGCRNCYARRLESTRLRHLNRCPKGFNAGPVYQGDKKLEQPLHWRRPRRVFPCASSDLFHPDVPDDLIKRAFEIMILSRPHEFMILTKRPKRMREFSRGLESLYKFHGDGSWNIWFGVSIEDQVSAEKRVPVLMGCIPRLFISYEPLIGPVDPTCIRFPHGGNENVLRCEVSDRARAAGIDKLNGIDWVICGGESGPAARPMHPDWARSIRDQCAAAGTPFFFKQWGEYAPEDLVDQATRYRFHERYAYGATQCKPNLIRYAGSDGTFTPAGDGCPDADATIMYRVGKKRAGHVLDGREFLAYPKARPAPIGAKEA